MGSVGKNYVMSKNEVCFYMLVEVDSEQPEPMMALWEARDRHVTDRQYYYGQNKSFKFAKIV